MANVVYVGSVPLPEHSIIDYSNSWETELQQLTSDLKPYAFTVSGLVGAVEKFGRVSSGSLNETAAYDPTGSTPTDRNRHQDIEIDELEMSSCWMSPKEFDKHYWYQYDDAALLGGIDASAAEAIPTLTAAAERVMDQIMLGVTIDSDSTSETYGQPILDTTADFYKHGIFGLTKQGEDVGTATGVALSATSDVASDYNGATAGEACGMTLKKIGKIRRILTERHMVSKTQKGKTSVVMVVTPEMVQQLIDDEERLGSSEYGFSALRDGNLLEVYGIRFVVSTFLPFIKSGDVYVRRAVAYLPQKLRFGVWKSMNIEVKDQPSKKKSYTIGGYCKFSCARTDDNAFITVDCLTDDATVTPTETDTDSDG